MKECRDCEFFEGYDYSDGTPICEEGYENCPYCNSANVKNNGVKIEVDAGFMTEYIRHTIQNTINDVAVNIATNEIKKLITDELKSKVKEEINGQIKETVSDAITEFMAKEITIGGGWCEPERTLTREEYLAETINKELGARFKADEMKNLATSEAKRAIDTYSRKLRDEINAGIQQNFNAATRATLTDNIVNMLMANDTYKKLSDSMKTFLPQGD